MAEQIAVTANDKAGKYNELFPQLCSLLEGESNLIANLANTTAALKMTFNHFWIGFYIVEQDELVLGPFQGTIACTRIAFGKGVCGTAWKEGKTLVVPNVNDFPGHIACSSLSQSEIVVPVFKDNRVVAVLDIDSELLNSFDNVDKDNLEKIAACISSYF
jgi:GAF domain-containing protein